MQEASKKRRLPPRNKRKVIKLSHEFIDAKVAEYLSGGGKITTLDVRRDKDVQICSHDYATEFLANDADIKF